MNLIKCVVAVASIVLLTNCTTGYKFSSISNGMNIEQVSKIVGNPDESLTYEGNRVYKWVDRRVSEWSNDTADFYVVIDKRNDKVAKYGRQNYQTAARPVYVAPRPFYVAPASTAPTTFSCDSSQLGSTTYTDCTGH